MVFRQKIPGAAERRASGTELKVTIKNWETIIKASKISRHIFISDGFLVKGNPIVIKADLQTILDFLSKLLDWKQALNFSNLYLLNHYQKGTFITYKK